MADSLTDLVARLRAAQPALADVPDDVLHAEVLTQLQARGGPSVGDALGEPTFRTSNEKDAGGQAVVRDAPPLGFLAPYFERGMDVLRGVTGLGDQGPAGPTWTNAGALLAALPVVAGVKRAATIAREGMPAVEEALQGIRAFHGSPSQYGDDLLSQFGSTARPEATSFLLHDGTRIRGGGNTTHADLANALGQHVDDLQLDGIVRNVPEHGIEVATPITEAQARIAVEDAKMGGYPLNVDVMVTGGHVKSKAFPRPSVAGVRNWIKEALK